VDGLGNNNLIEIITVALMKCGGLTREEVAKKIVMLWCRWGFYFYFLGGDYVTKQTKDVWATFNGCPLCGSPD